MLESADVPLIRRKFREVFGASLTPCFGSFLHRGCHADSGAALGYRRAGSEPLFLECYLDQPVETAVSAALERPVARERIVEIGNFAAASALTMIELWGAAANDLGARSEVAVATLTAPLRDMFARIGLPVAVLAPARRDRLGEGAGAWGCYYDLDPQVCAGVIADGQRAIGAFLQRRRREAA